MPDESPYGVVLFHTTSAALRAEKKLVSGGLKVKLIPTPRQLSSDCGIALRFDWPRADTVRTSLETAHVDFGGIHRLES